MYLLGKQQLTKQRELAPRRKGDGASATPVQTAKQRELAPRRKGDGASATQVQTTKQRELAPRRKGDGASATQVQTIKQRELAPRRKGFLKKGFIQKEKKEWAATVRQISIVPAGINSSLVKRCELKRTKISCLSVSRVVA